MCGLFHKLRALQRRRGDRATNMCYWRTGPIHYYITPANRGPAPVVATGRAFSGDASGGRLCQRRLIEQCLHPGLILVQPRTGFHVASVHSIFDLSDIEPHIRIAHNVARRRCLTRCPLVLRRPTLVNFPHDFLCPANCVTDGTDPRGHPLPAVPLRQFPSGESQP